MKRFLTLCAMCMLCAAFTGGASANTMEMTRGGNHRQESIVGAEGLTTATADIKFSVDFQYINTDNNANQANFFGVKLHQVSTGASGFSNIDDWTDPGLYLSFAKQQSNPVDVGLILYDGVTTDGVVLATTSYLFDNDWHRLDFHFLDGATTGTSFVNIDGSTVLFDRTDVPLTNYDLSTGRNFQIEGGHRLAGTPVQFDNIRINEMLVSDFDDITSPPSATIDAAGGEDWVVRNRFNFMSLNTSNDSLAVPVELGEFTME